MSKALRCDRCKTCFDPYACEGEFVTFEDIIFQDGVSFNNHEVSYREGEPVHLCPKCALHFRNWFYNYEKEVEERCTSSANYNKIKIPMGKFSDFQKNDLPPSASCASSKAEDAAQKNIVMAIDDVAASVLHQLSDLAESFGAYGKSQK